MRKPWALLGVSFALVMIDGYDLFIVSFVAPLIAKDLHLNFMNIAACSQLAWQLYGRGLLLGHIADRAGRRPALIVSLTTAGVATLLCSQAHSLGAFAALRFLTGLALGGLLAAIVPLVAEHFPSQKRGAAVTMMFIGYPLGAVIGGANHCPVDRPWLAKSVSRRGSRHAASRAIALLLRETLYASEASIERPHRELRENPSQPCLPKDVSGLRSLPHSRSFACYW